MAGYDGSIRIDSRIDPKGFNVGIKALIASLGTLAKAMIVTFGITAVVNFGKSAVQAASEVSSAMLGLQSIMQGQGRSFTEAKKFINDYIADGLVPMTNAVTAYKNLAMRGYSDEQIRKTLISLKDAAAFGRQASLTMGQAVQSATEGLKNENSILVDNSGVTKNVSMMWKDYAASIGKTVNELTKEEKILAEVNGIHEESKYQVGDAAKLAGTYAGKVSSLGVSFYNLRAAIGNTIIPILAQIIPYVKTALDWLTRLFNTLSQYIQAWFGYDPSATMDAYGQATENAANAQGDLASATEEAAKAAKGQLAAFDELNVLSKKEETPAATPVPVTPAGGQEQGGGVLGEIQARVEAFKQTLLDFFAPASEAFDRLKEALEPLGQTIWAGLKWAYDNVLKPIGDWLAQQAAPVFLDLFASRATLLDTALKALAPVGKDIYDNFLVPLGNWAGQAIIDIMKSLTEQLNNLSDWIKENPEKFQTITEIILAFFAAWKVEQLIASIVKMIAHFVTATVTIATNTAAWIANTAAKIADKAETIAIAALLAGDFIKNLAASVVKLGTDTAAWIANTAAKIAANAAQIAMNIAVGIWNGIAVVATAVTTAFGAAVAFLTSPVGLVVIAIVALVAIIVLLIKNWDKVKETAGRVWDWIVDKWNKAGAWFTTNVTDPIKNAFKTALDWVEDKWQTVWDGIKGFAKNSINGIIDFVNGLIQAVASGLNILVDKLNSIRIDVPSILGSPEIHFGLNIPPIVAPQIPRLATGAVVPAHANMLAMIGEGSQREVVAPEPMLRQIVREELAANGGQEISIRFEGSLAQFVRQLDPVIKREQNRKGGNLVKGVTA